jgi:hypothetical protein
MPASSFRRFYRRGDFTALPAGEINVPVLVTALAALVFDVSIVDVSPLDFGDGVTIEWEGFPSVADVTALDAFIAAFIGGATTSQPFTTVSAAATTTTSATAVSKIDFTTPALDAGTYQIIFSSQFRMLANVAGEAARAISIITAAPAAPVDQQDHWGESVVKAYNGSATILRTAGQTIRVQLQIAEVGPGVGTAEMSKARVTIDKID